MADIYFSINVTFSKTELEFLSKILYFNFVAKKKDIIKVINKILNRD